MTGRNLVGARGTIIGLVILGAALLAGCQQLADPNAPQTTVFPSSSDYGVNIQYLYSLIFVMAVVVFVGVEGFLVYAIVRFRRRRDNEMPSQVHGNTGLEITWTVLPSIILLIIAVPTISTIFANDAVPPTVTQHVTVVGHQWWWEFQYPDLGVVTANEFHLPVGQTALIEIQSADVIHSFWIPKMGGKMDAVPTRINHLWFTPAEIGNYAGQCVEFCGIQHANMRDRLFVDSQPDFDAWVARQKSVGATPATPFVKKGQDLFVSPQNPCFACHTVRGTSAQGTIGPDLTHVGSRTTIAAGVLDNTPTNLQHWIQDAQKYKVGTKMPTTGLSDANAEAIAAYLMSLQ